VYSRWLFGVFDDFTIPLVVRVNRASRTADGVAPGFDWRY